MDPEKEKEKEPEQEINLPVAYKPNDKIAKKLNLLNQKGKEQILTFLGKNEVEAMFYLYLFKKYNSDCFLTTINSGARLLGMVLPVQDEYSNKENYEILAHFDELIKGLIQCISKPHVSIVIIPVCLSLPNNKGHANVLIYRKKQNQIEHFEPHGKYFGMNQNYKSKIIHIWLDRFVEGINAQLETRKMQKINLIKSNDVCPYLRGLQSMESRSDLAIIADKEPGGYCAAWSMFFTELCLKNPDVSSNTLLNRIFLVFENMSEIKQNNYLKEVIRGYSAFISEKINKYFAIFFGDNFTIEKLKKIQGREQLELHKIIRTLIRAEMTSLTDPSRLTNSINRINKDIIALSEKIGAGEIDEDEASFLLQDYVDNLTNATQTQHVSDKLRKAYLSSASSSTPIAPPIAPTKTRRRRNASLVETNLNLTACPPGKQRNPLTNRCINIKPSKTQKASETHNKPAKSVKNGKNTKTLKPCPPGKKRNPLTNRCINVKSTTTTIRNAPLPHTPLAIAPDTHNKTAKKATTAKTVKILSPCPPGKERNPLTNRCIKIRL